ncbi:hypothetical protein ASE14_13595 [Agromyces sp. Root81]|uniref:hypothetical protein n=1 Tax=Agromyces sp. Root81 TaxID=1736601 RepID=UPI0006F4A972|nr:hypothetical protein [Agromyces sp. Root81]KRC61831.1 hypothetical protein ASE14_13595 [Agromyces sp. Root81]
MIRRLATNPAVLVLVAVVLLCVVGTVWGLQTNLSNQGGMSWTGEPSEEVLWQMRMMQISGTLTPITTFVGVAALLGLLVIASASRHRSDRPRPEEST